MIKAISFLLVATFCATTISCRKAENLNELINKSFLYYSKNEPLKPFNGTAYSNKMMRGIEHRMSSYNFKKVSLAAVGKLMVIRMKFFRPAHSHQFLK
jgi:hypothetical protein